MKPIQQFYTQNYNFCLRNLYFWHFFQRATRWSFSSSRNSTRTCSVSRVKNNKIRYLSANSSRTFTKGK